MIALPPLGELEDRLWLALMDIAERRATDWTLVGGQMVLLHALEHGVTPPRISTDLDLVVDARVRPPAIPAMAEVLDGLGFRPGPISADGVGHRFVRGPVTIDLLAPEGAGPRADLAIGGGAETVPVGGGTYALSRSQLVDVSAGGRAGRVPRPDLAGALVLKAAAARSDRKRGPERHLGDLAFLHSLVPDPFALRDELGAKNCGRIRTVSALADADHPAWGGLDAPARSRAKAAFTLVTGRAVA
ncbi:MAG: hypothetical protein IT200_01600 [Thermoleophilia bacterium]|nr:hypothetical protein [Thermoleophilia bacterium]